MIEQFSMDIWTISTMLIAPPLINALFNANELSDISMDLEIILP